MGIHWPVILVLLLERNFLLRISSLNRKLDAYRSHTACNDTGQEDGKYQREEGASPPFVLAPGGRVDAA